MFARLEGKSFLVTGSTSGIGEAIARRIVAEGGAVTITGLGSCDAEKVATDIVASGGRAAWAAGDLMDTEVPARIVQAHVDAFGGMNGLVNNAGISPRSNLETTTVELWDKVMAINARAPMLFVQASWPHLRKANRASIVNIGSINAHAGWSQLLAYSMSKGALMTMTRNMAAGLAPDRIRVNQLNLGWTLTENERRLAELDGRPEYWIDTLPEGTFPLGRMFQPDDVTPMVCYLLSSESELLSGTVIEFDQRNRIGV